MISVERIHLLQGHGLGIGPSYGAIRPATATLVTSPGPTEVQYEALKAAIATLRQMRDRLASVLTGGGQGYADYKLVFATATGGAGLDQTNRTFAPAETQQWYAAWQVAERYAKTGMIFYGAIGGQPATIAGEIPATDNLIYWANEALKKLAAEAAAEAQARADQARAQADAAKAAGDARAAAAANQAAADAQASANAISGRRKVWIVGGVLAAGLVGVIAALAFGSKKRRR